VKISFSYLRIFSNLKFKFFQTTIPVLKVLFAKAIFFCKFHLEVHFLNFPAEAAKIAKPFFKVINFTENFIFQYLLNLNFLSKLNF
jgi:hypothetical protein